jgi:deazaflavin-dependent oxidoreductase (nitroreductase family)
MSGREGDRVAESPREDAGIGVALAQLCGEEFCYLTTTGRVSSRPHEIEIWFAVSGTMVYFMSGGGERSDWVKNLRHDPQVMVRIGGDTFSGTAREVRDSAEDALARRLLADKYGEYEDDGQPTEWARTALPIAVDLNM